LELRTPSSRPQTSALRAAYGKSPSAAIRVIVAMITECPYILVQTMKENYSILLTVKLNV